MCSPPSRVTCSLRLIILKQTSQLGAAQKRFSSLTSLPVGWEPLYRFLENPFRPRISACKFALQRYDPTEPDRPRND